ncbi:eukaryotic rRNA processing [Gigaspora margarita]|uniref:Eukaryotic rRNA processing n=1 Tax=Gigaspora margarita TaxID=4874 RepID=A0A8H4B166_GIGMA|nr:eukaryotic rRNA processing [Gigaspora margarita]
MISPNNYINKSALKKSYNEIKIDAPWIETQVITSSEPVSIKDIDNDIERELAFYKQALEGAIEGRKNVIASGVSFSRPDDYFAEMVKSDVHMTRIRQKLVNEEQSIKASEEARRLRELKKFGKKIQVEKIQERQKKKKEELEKIKVMKKKRKGVEDTALDDDFDIALEQAAADDRPKKKQKTGKNGKRVNKDARYGFGGKKRYSKSNTADSSADFLSQFDPKNDKSFGGRKALMANKKRKFTKKRPGKTRRKSARNKK